METINSLIESSQELLLLSALMLDVRNFLNFIFVWIVQGSTLIKHFVIVICETLKLLITKATLLGHAKYRDLRGYLNVMMELISFIRICLERIIVFL
jgi:hypothetical protein